MKCRLIGCTGVQGHRWCGQQQEWGGQASAGGQLRRGRLGGASSEGAPQPSLCSIYLSCGMQFMTSRTCTSVDAFSEVCLHLPALRRICTCILEMTQISLNVRQLHQFILSTTLDTLLDKQNSSLEKHKVTGKAEFRKSGERSLRHWTYQVSPGNQNRNVIVHDSQCSTGS